MGKVTHGDSVLLLDVVKEGSLVVDLEVEDAVLIRQLEVGAVRRALLRANCGLQRQTVERRKHAELKLQIVPGWYLEGGPVIPLVLGQRY